MCECCRAAPVPSWRLASSLGLARNLTCTLRHPPQARPGATGGPVISSAYPEWIAEYMLEQNNGYYPLPVSMSSMLAYLFPATVQAYWDEVLEHAFAANQQRLNSALLGLPTAFVAPIMFVLDLVCSAGLVLFTLANAKLLAALAAVAVVGRARRVAKA